MTDPYLCSCSTPLLLQVKADLERHEGFREFAYPDPLSKIARRYKHLPWGYKSARELLALVTDLNEEDGKPWTYGFGFTSKVTPDGRISRQMAERKLEEHILQMDALLSSKLSWYKDASTVTKGVLINMAFNMGINGLLGFKNTLKFIAAKNYKQAAANMRLSKWYGQVGSRAKELVARMETQTVAAADKAPERI